MRTLCGTILAAAVALAAQGAEARVEVMDMVHHNPGEPFTVSAFNNPAKVAACGMDAMVVNEFVFPQCACTFDDFDSRVFPSGSKERAWVMAVRDRMREKARACHAAGIRCYYFMDIIVFPKRLVELYREEVCGPDGRISFAKPLTRELHRIMLDELFEAVPELDGLVVRTGETYLNNTPYHIGNGPVDYKNAYEESKELHAELMNLLREEVCVKKGRRVYYRTWDFGFFHTRPDYYLEVTDKVEPHPLFTMSVKHTKGDYLRTFAFNPTLGIGKHRQIVEVQCAREYEGKGAFVNYVADSVVSGYEENADDPGMKSLAEFAKSPLFAGVWTWSRGGGSCGPYLQNELWCDMNAWVMANWAKDPARGEESIFNAYLDRLGVEPGSRAALRELALLSQKAIIRGRGTMLFKGKDLKPYMKEPDNWLFIGWTRDDALGGVDQLAKTMDGLIADGLVDARLAEMEEATRMWARIVELARAVKCRDKAAEHYVLTSALYGEALHRIMYHGCAVVFKGYEAEKTGAVRDEALIARHAAAYDRAWADYRRLKAECDDCATLYLDEYPRYVPKSPEVPNGVLHGPGLGAAVLRYRLPRASFAAFDSRAKAGERLTVVFFGGSLTWSANATEPNRTGFRGVMADWFEKTYSTAHFTFVDAAIGGTGSNLGMFRLERDVLARKPDLVFLDFSCNDGGENRKILNTCCYEYLLRRMIGEGIPVVQMFFTFKSWAKHGAPYDVSGCHPRLIDYRSLVDVYGTAVGDVYTDGLIPDLDAGRIDPDRDKALDKIWPIDGGHPGDLGYWYFALAGIAGYKRAVASGLVCRVPEKPVFGTVKDVRRWNPADGELPSGWTRKLTYRTSAWYDGLSSRWMDDVAVFGGTSAAPLAFSAKGNFVGIFGEGDDKALKFAMTEEGNTLASFDASPHIGARLFIWRPKALDGWEKGEGAERDFALVPLPSADGKGELRVGSICTATIVPSVTVNDAGSVFDAGLEKLDHARGN